MAKAKKDEEVVIGQVVVAPAEVIETTDSPAETTEAPAEVEVADDSKPIEFSDVKDEVTGQPLPQEYVDAGNTEYSGTSEMGKDVGRGFDDSKE